MGGYGVLVALSVTGGGMWFGEIALQGPAVPLHRIMLMQRMIRPGARVLTAP